MAIEKLIDSLPEWLSGKGAYPELILSSRARIARNLKHFRFNLKMDDRERIEVCEIIKEALQELPEFQKSEFIEIKELRELDRQFLIERHLITKDLLKNPICSGVMFNENETVSAMINEEDHLRLQVLAPGFNLDKTFELIATIDERLGLLLPFAFDKEFGYLTSCPTNAGLGLRFSVLIHIPAIIFQNNLEKLAKILIDNRVSLRGLYGEGSEIVGNIVQISTGKSMGITPEELLESFKETIKKVIELEKESRASMENGAIDFVEDSIYRAKATLLNAKLLSFEETARLASSLRLGLALGKILDYSIKTLNELTLFSQPAHIQKLYGQEMSQRERDKARAKFVKDKLLYTT